MSRVFAFLLLFLTLPALAQVGSVYHSKTTMRVDVIYPNGSHASAHLRVQLRQGINGMLVAMDNTNSSGNVEFSELDPGDYDVRVTGDGVEPGDSGTFTIEETKEFLSVTVTVKPAASAEAGTDVRGASIAASDLNVPKKASKEYEHAGEEMEAGNWDKAIDHLNKAIVLYPQYSAAYNDLGVCYGHLKQKDKQREALLKAISINEHCTPALINLAHMEMKDNQLIEATDTLKRTLTTEPSSIDALTMLTEVEFREGHYDMAIIDAHKVHGLAHHYASVHYTAAEAWQKENHIQEAVAELKTFLVEEPQGPRADVVRKVLGEMQSTLNQAQTQPQEKSATEGDPAAR